MVYRVRKKNCDSSKGYLLDRKILVTLAAVLEMHYNDYLYRGRSVSGQLQ